MPNEPTLSRRDLLKAAGGLTLTGAAGCLDGSSATENTTTTENYDSEETTYEQKTTETTTEQPEQKIDKYKPLRKMPDPQNFGITNGFLFQFGTPNAVYNSLSEEDQEFVEEDWQTGAYANAPYLGAQPHKLVSFGVEASSGIEYLETDLGVEEMLRSARDAGFEIEGSMGAATFLVGENIELKSIGANNNPTDKVGLLVADGEAFFMPYSHLAENDIPLDEAGQTSANTSGNNSGEKGTVRRSIMDEYDSLEALEEHSVSGGLMSIGNINTEDGVSFSGFLYEKAEDGFEYDIGIKGFRVTDDHDLKWVDEIDTGDITRWDGDREE